MSGWEVQSLIRKSPSRWTISSARWRVNGPWYQACERKSREFKLSSHSSAFFRARASCNSWPEADVVGSEDIINPELHSITPIYDLISITCNVFFLTSFYNNWLNLLKFINFRRVFLKFAKKEADIFYLDRPAIQI